MLRTLTGPSLKFGFGLFSTDRVWGRPTSAPPDAEEAQALLSKAVELGIAIFDTVPAYAESEARLGRFLASIEPSRRPVEDQRRSKGLGAGSLMGSPCFSRFSKCAAEQATEHSRPRSDQ
jgi:hypothetical protein